MRTLIFKVYIYIPYCLVAVFFFFSFFCSLSLYTAFFLFLSFLTIMRYTAKLRNARSIGIKKGVIMAVGLGALMFFLYSTYALAFW